MRKNLNVSSGKVMKKCNMIYEGTLREVQFRNGRFCTLSVYSVLRNEWLEMNNKVIADSVDPEPFVDNRK